MSTSQESYTQVDTQNSLLSFFLVRPPKKWQKPPQTTLLLCNKFSILKFKNPLVGYYLAFSIFYSTGIIITFILILGKLNSTANFVNSIVILIKLTQHCCCTEAINIINNKHRAIIFHLWIYLM